jgi:hypothetical protein
MNELSFKGTYIDSFLDMHQVRCLCRRDDEKCAVSLSKGYIRLSMYRNNVLRQHLDQMQMRRLFHRKMMGQYVHQHSLRTKYLSHMDQL